MEKEVVVNGKKFVIRELKYKDMTKLVGIPQEQAAKDVLLQSTGMTEEQFNELTIKEGVSLQLAINELNGLQDFQKLPTK